MTYTQITNLRMRLHDARIAYEYATNEERRREAKERFDAVQDEIDALIDADDESA